MDPELSVTVTRTLLGLGLGLGVLATISVVGCGGSEVALRAESGDAVLGQFPLACTAAGSLRSAVVCREAPEGGSDLWKICQVRLGASQATECRLSRMPRRAAVRSQDRLVEWEGPSLGFQGPFDHVRVLGHQAGGTDLRMRIVGEDIRVPVFHDSSTFIGPSAVDNCFFEADYIRCIPSWTPTSVQGYGVFVDGVQTGEMPQMYVYADDEIGRCLWVSDDFESWHSGFCRDGPGPRIADAHVFDSNIVRGPDRVINTYGPRITSIPFSEYEDVVEVSIPSMAPIVSVALMGDWLLVTSRGKGLWLNARTLEPRAPWIHE